MKTKLFLLFIYLLVLSFVSYGQPCQDNMIITNTISSGSPVYNKAKTITASNIITAGASPTYEAGNQIYLKPGFHAQRGSKFVGKIAPGSCCDQISFQPVNPSCISSNCQVCKSAGLQFRVNNATWYEYTIINRTTGVTVFGDGDNIRNGLCNIKTNINTSAGSYSLKIAFHSSCTSAGWFGFNFDIIECKSSVKEPEEKETFIEEISTNEIDFATYPNPNSGVFTLKVNNIENDPYTVQILNIQGKLLHVIENVASNEIQIDQSNLAKGIYMIRILVKDKIIIKKLVITNL